MPDAMSDPMTWSVSVGRYFGIRVRVHLLFLGFMVVQILGGWFKNGVEGVVFQSGLCAVLFFSVLFHEFGHCFAGRAVGGEAEEILMWPLGGLAYVSVPRTPRAEFIMTVWGPLVNVFICLIAGAVIVLAGQLPPFNPFAGLVDPKLFGPNVPIWLFWVSLTFFVNWTLLLFNMVPAFPMDCGRMFRSLLWSRIGFLRATLIAVQVAKVCAILMGFVGLLTGPDVLLIGIAFFVYFSSESERRMLEAGEYMEDNPFGYDFSQGYTSLAKSTPKPKARRQGVWERWRRRRERIRQQKQLAAQQAEERRVDEILDKVHRDGIASLTDQERRFLNRASEKARSRNRSD